MSTEKTTPDISVTIRVEINVDRSLKNHGSVLTVFDVEGAPTVVKMLRAAHDRGEMNLSMELFTATVCELLGPQQPVVSEKSRGNA